MADFYRLNIFLEFEYICGRMEKLDNSIILKDEKNILKVLNIHILLIISYEFMLCMRIKQNNILDSVKDFWYH